MTTVLAVWNRALSAAHAPGHLSSPEDAGPLAELCRRWYPHVLRVVQEAAMWESCQTQVQLALLSTSDDTSFDERPHHGYEYLYALPEGYLRPWYLTSKAPFTLSYTVGLERMGLSTNTEKAVLIYARLQENPAMWTAGQTNATVYGLAGAITAELSGKRSLVADNYQLADNALVDARAVSANNQNDIPNQIPPTIAARWGGLRFSRRTDFVYPFGPLFNESLDG